MAGLGQATSDTKNRQFGLINLGVPHEPSVFVHAYEAPFHATAVQLPVDVHASPIAETRLVPPVSAPTRNLAITLQVPDLSTSVIKNSEVPGPVYEPTTTQFPTEAHHTPARAASWVAPVFAPAGGVGLAAAPHVPEASDTSSGFVEVPDVL